MFPSLLQGIPPLTFSKDESLSFKCVFSEFYNRPTLDINIDFEKANISHLRSTRSFR
jgi:hypothetical protein